MKRELKKLSETEYDVAIVGAGINGACAAWDATLRGLKVALIDKADFGNATSSNSLKIIHGGLRYLQNLDLKRMRESINERKILMKNAPHLIHPLPVIMPTYGSSMKSRSAMFAALLANDLIGLDRNNLEDPQKYLPNGKVISNQQVEEYVPGFDGEKFTGGALWYDCVCSNTERLVLSYVLSAAEKGADAANYVECIGFLGDEHKITGIKVKEHFTKDVFDIRAKVVVNSSGPWVDDILSGLNGNAIKKKFRHSLGINIVVNRKILDNHALAIPGPVQNRLADGTIFNGKQILFFVPWQDYTMIGTSHLPYDRNPYDLEIRENEVENFLNSINQAYPAANIKKEEISLVHRGLLPMKNLKPNTGEVLLERHYKIYDHFIEDKIEGIVSIIGVKYTTHRDVASKIINTVVRKLNKKSVNSITEDMPVYGGEIEKFDDYLSEARRISGFDNHLTDHLVYNYGSKYQEILKLMDNGKADKKTSNNLDGLLRAEILNSVRNEMAQKLSDVIFRRTDLGSAQNPGRNTLESVAKVLAEEFHWNDKRIREEVKETLSFYPISNN
jgi:glycerol-3-phosphate dehydrogenase